jgi:hypothetical protein
MGTVLSTPRLLREAKGIGALTLIPIQMRILRYIIHQRNATRRKRSSNVTRTAQVPVRLLLLARQRRRVQLRMPLVILITRRGITRAILGAQSLLIRPETTPKGLRLRKNYPKSNGKHILLYSSQIKVKQPLPRLREKRRPSPKRQRA